MSLNQCQIYPGASGATDPGPPRIRAPQKSNSKNYFRHEKTVYEFCYDFVLVHKKWHIVYFYLHSLLCFLAFSINVDNI